MSVASGTFNAIARLLKSGVPTSDKTVTGIVEDTAVGQRDFGSSSDLWGTSWTSTDINSNLTAEVQFNLGSGTFNGSTNGGADFGLDAVLVAVHYTLAGKTYSQTTVAIGISPVFRL